MWQGTLTYHERVIKLNIWPGGLPHLPGVPDLHVNRPLKVVCGQKFFPLSLKSFMLCLHFGRAFSSNILTEKSNILAKRRVCRLVSMETRLFARPFSVEKQTKYRHFPLNFPRHFSLGKLGPCLSYWPQIGVARATISPPFCL